MSRDVRSHVKLLEQEYQPEYSDVPHAYIEQLGFVVRLVKVEPGTAVVAPDVYGLAVTRDGTPVLLVGSRFERIDLAEDES